MLDYVPWKVLFLRHGAALLPRRTQASRHDRYVPIRHVHPEPPCRWPWATTWRGAERPTLPRAACSSANTMTCVLESEGRSWLASRTSPGHRSAPAVNS